MRPLAAAVWVIGILHLYQTSPRLAKPPVGPTEMAGQTIARTIIIFGGLAVIWLIPA